MIFVCKLVIVFDDSVMDQGNLMILVGMGILAGNAAVSGPAGVADAAVGNI